MIENLLQATVKSVILRFTAYSPFHIVQKTNFLEFFRKDLEEKPGEFCRILLI